MKLEQKGFFVRSPPNCCGGCSLKLATNGLLLTPGWLTRDKSERKKKKLETFAEAICFSNRNSDFLRSSTPKREGESGT